jgi:hypothetical protein
MAASAMFTANVASGMDFGSCANGADTWVSTFTAASDSVARSTTGDCPTAYTPNFR